MSRSSEALITSGWHPSPQVGGWEDALTETGSNGGIGCGIERYGQGSPMWSFHKALMRSCNHFSKELLVIPGLYCWWKNMS